MKKCLLFILFVIVAYFPIQGFLGAQTAFAQKNKKEDLLKKLSETSNAFEKADILNELSATLESSDFPAAIDFAKKALEISREEGYEKAQAQALLNLGKVYRLKGDYADALKYCLDALSLFEKIKDQAGTAAALSNTGIIYYFQENYDAALQNYSRALSIARQIDDKATIAGSLNNIGNVYFAQAKYETALQAYTEALQINESVNNIKYAANNLLNIGGIYRQQKNTKEALKYYFEAMELLKKEDEKEDLAGAYLAISYVYFETREYRKALEYAEEGMNIAKSIGAKALILENYMLQSDLYQASNDFKNAYLLYKSALIYKDSVNNEASNEKIARIQSEYNFEKQQAQIDLLNAETRRSNLIRNVLVIGLLLLLAIAYFFYRNYKNKQKQAAVLQEANLRINLQNTELAEQKALIEAKKQDIDSSIRYAKRIQTAVMPLEEKMQPAFKDFFVLLRPRDVVSGDFYWFSEVPPVPIYSVDPQTNLSVLEGFSNEKILVAAVDSTGHGIPGAFMSMLGTGMLNQIVNNKGIQSPDQILNELHQEIRTTLKQHQNRNHDGMDIALCSIDYEAGVLEFSGAHSPLVYVKDKEVYEVKADGQGIGGYLGRIEQPFSKTSIAIESPLACYLFSDGYKDQFGGKNGKKFTTRKFKELLLEIHAYPMEQQKKILETTLEQWMKDEPQVDDILVVGFRI